MAFEAHRKEVINNAIKGTQLSLQHKLKGMQFRIDMERRRARTPMASYLKLSEIMMNYFYEEHVPGIN